MANTSLTWLLVASCLLAAACKKPEGSRPEGSRPCPGLETIPQPSLPDQRALQQLVKGMRPPVSTTADYFERITTLQLSGRELRLDGESIVRLQNGKIPESELDPKTKRFPKLDLKLRPLRQKAAQAASVALVADRDLVFASVYPLMRSAALTGFTGFRLVVTGKSAEIPRRHVAGIQIILPVRLDDEKPPALSLHIEPDKLVLNPDTPDKIEIPNQAGTCDLAALSSAAQKLHISNPEIDLARVVLHKGVPEKISYQTLVSILDTIRQATLPDGRRKKMYTRITMSLAL